jgi:ATP-dependent RNA helicase SUPV3L1/SUV3
MEATRVVALLGPTNTGKTHRALGRMLDFSTGMIGLPLRLLAREVYDRLTAQLGEARVALVTGEEKRVPKSADYWVCTTEAMPVDRAVEFLAVDEVQLAAHPQRGHVFTERLLHARGTRETWFLGSEAARGVLEALVPAASVVSHPRLSRLRYAGPTKLARVPPRSAVVAFSLDQVYAVAERLRAVKGGAAVVLGALSPRARNAQVAMYQAGEVDYLVATDAIGMGLNLDLRHVAFAALRKYDGRETRPLDVHELSQIAGRAGRWIYDGTFGTVLPEALPPDVAAAVEHHQVVPLTRVFWRPEALDYTSLDDLLVSLQRPSPRRVLQRVAEAEDTRALSLLAERPSVRALATHPERVALLWEVCGIPDYRKLLWELHADFLEEVYVALTGRTGRIDAAWFAPRLAALDDTGGDVDDLVARIAAVRSFAYLAHQGRWVHEAEALQARTRDLEDRLSDALHARLVLRFVDQPAGGRGVAVQAARRPRTGSGASAAAESLEGPARGHPFAALASLRGALPGAPKGAVPEPEARGPWVEALVEAAHARFATDGAGRMLDREGGAVLARLEAGSSVGRPGLRLVGLDELGAGARDRVHRRLLAWTRDHVGALMEPVRSLGRGRDDANLRGLIYQLDQSLGTVPSRRVRALVDALDAETLAALDAAGLVRGARVTWHRALLSAEAMAQRAELVRVWAGEALPLPPLGRASVPVPRGTKVEAWWAAGYAVYGGRAVRCDLAERALHEALGGDEAAARRTLGCPAGEAIAVLQALRMDTP